MKATWYQYIEISSFCKGNFTSELQQGRGMSVVLVVIRRPLSNLFHDGRYLKLKIGRILLHRNVKPAF